LGPSHWPEVGRFVQQDPIGTGSNWYAYVEDNPLRWVDPSGLKTVEECKQDCEEDYQTDRKRCYATSLFCVGVCQLEPTPVCELVCLAGYTVCMVWAKGDRARCIEDCEEDPCPGGGGGGVGAR